MNEHLSKIQIADYEKSPDSAESVEIGRHLLECGDCRERMPVPTAEQFLSAIFRETEFPETKGESVSVKPGLLGVFGNPQTLIWSGGALVVVLGFTFLLWMIVGPPLKSGREVVRLADPGKVEQSFEKRGDYEQPPLSQPLPVVQANPKATPNSFIQKKPNKASPKSRSKLPAENKENFSSTRGVTPKCTDENSIEMEVGSNDSETIVFRWVKVPNALKYHLYISDDEEILIDEYETERETVYVLKKMLDPAKTYKWKVVITLENGQTSAGTSQKFTVKDVLQNQKKLIK